MPLIEIKVFEDEFTDDERAGVIHAVTDAIVGFTGESHPPAHLGRARTTSRAAAGASAAPPLGLTDVRALQAQPTPPRPKPLQLTASDEV